MKEGINEWLVSQIITDLDLYQFRKLKFEITANDGIYCAFYLFWPDCDQRCSADLEYT